MSRSPISFVLAPMDQGVRNLEGRDGTAKGPQALLDALQARSCIPAGSSIERVQVENDAQSLEADLDALSAVVAQNLATARRVVVLGGDHGTTYGTVRGASRALGAVGVLYLDVHLDMRPFEPVHTSGSSFRRLVEEGHVSPEHVVPLGIEEPRDPERRKRSRFDALTGWAAHAGVDWTPIEQLRGPALARAVEDAMAPTPAWCASFDVDCLDEGYAPGVSAPGKGRFTPEELAPALAAAWERCRVLDVVELCPRLDEQGRTVETVADLLAPLLSDASGS